MNIVNNHSLVAQSAYDGLVGYTSQSFVFFGFFAA